jgi:branched-chain amino acid transport system substrate-binding protein
MTKIMSPVVGLLLGALSLSSPLGYLQGAQLSTTSVRLCVSVPLGDLPLHALSQGVVNATELATERWTKRFRQAHLTLLPPLIMDDALAIGTKVDPRREEANARTCVRRNNTFGYVGPLNSGVAEVSEPVLNEAGLVQMSGANTLPDLTSPGMRAQLEPATFRHRFAYPTYYRTVAPDDLQGPADASFLRFGLKVRSYFVVSEPAGVDTYADVLSQGVKRYGSKIGLNVIGSATIRATPVDTTVADSEAVANLVEAKGAQAVFVATGDPGSSVIFFKTLRAQGYRGPIVGGDSIFNPDFPRSVGSAARNIFASAAGLDPAGEAKSFRLAYTRRFHTSPVVYTAGSYDAANIELHSIFLASTRGDLRGSLTRKRAAILPYVAHVHWRGALGETSFDADGDTRNPLVSLYTVRHRAWVFIGVAPRLKGVK